MNVKYCTCLLLACLLFFILCNPLLLYFLSDDFDSMYLAQTWSGVVHSYRPGSDFLLHTDHLLYGYNASAYHVTNYLLHFLTTFMLFFTTQQLLQPFYNKATIDKYAVTASLIFLFYPFHSECIFWLVGRSSLLAALFAMGSVYGYLRKKENAGWYVLSLVCLMLGLFSYESIWMLPVIIIIISMVYDKAFGTQKKLLYVSGYWLIFFIYLAARFYLTTTVIGSPYGTQKIVTFNVLFLLRNLASLVSRSFVPPMQSSVAFVACLCVMAAIIGFVLYKIRRRIGTPILFVSIAYALCLLPVISLGIDTHDTESERFLYMPSAFLSMLMSVLLFVLFKKKTTYVIGAFLLVEMCFLKLSYLSFEGASKVTRTTIQGLQTIRYSSAIYCINLPGQYKGGFIFRNGIANASNLFASATNEVHIVSKSELFYYPQIYNFSVYSITSLPAVYKSSGIPVKTNNRTVIFIWTNTSLNIYK